MEYFNAVLQGGTVSGSTSDIGNKSEIVRKSYGHLYLYIESQISAAVCSFDGPKWNAEITESREITVLQ